MTQIKVLKLLPQMKAMKMYSSSGIMSGEAEKTRRKAQDNYNIYGKCKWRK